jgi:hypothetical protein
MNKGNQPVKGYRMPLSFKPDDEFLTEEEFRGLQELYDAGRLRSISDHLLEFVVRHKRDILALATPSASQEDLLAAAKVVIRKRGSIHLPSEMADQIKEINNEIWFRGEHGDFDRSKIQEEWAVRFAGQWRSWRVKEILYVVDRMGLEILQRLV